MKKKIPCREPVISIEDSHVLSRQLFCGVCGKRWYRAGDYRGEACIKCYQWGELEEVKIHYRRQGLGLCPCGEVIKGEGLCMKCSWEETWFREATWSSWLLSSRHRDLDRT